MAITKKTPKKIWLGGPGEVHQADDATGLGTNQATEAITPGHLIERVANGAKLDVQKNGTSGAVTQAFVALNQPELNLGIDDAYAIGDNVKTLTMHTGAWVWGLIASGQTISQGEYLESAGDGTWQTDASGDKSYYSMDNPGAVTVSTRLRVYRCK